MSSALTGSAWLTFVMSPITVGVRTLSFYSFHLQVVSEYFETLKLDLEILRINTQKEVKCLKMSHIPFNKDPLLQHRFQFKF